MFCYVSFYWNIYCYFIKYTDILLLNTNYFIQHQYDILVLKLCSWLVSAELLLSLSGIVALSQIIAAIKLVRRKRQCKDNQRHATSPVAAPGIAIWVL